jgi:hypothetical protein
MSEPPEPFPHLRRVAALYQQGLSTERLCAELHLSRQTLWVFVSRARRLGLITRGSPISAKPGRRHVCKGCGGIGHTRRGCHKTRGGLRVE